MFRGVCGAPLFECECDWGKQYVGALAVPAADPPTTPSCPSLSQHRAPYKSSSHSSPWHWLLRLLSGAAHSRSAIHPSISTYPPNDTLPVPPHPRPTFWISYDYMTAGDLQEKSSVHMICTLFPYWDRRDRRPVYQFCLTDQSSPTFPVWDTRDMKLCLYGPNNNTQSLLWIMDARTTWHQSWPMCAYWRLAGNRTSQKGIISSFLQAGSNQETYLGFYPSLTFNLMQKSILSLRQKLNAVFL